MHQKSQQVALPEPVVCEGVRGDGVLPAEVHQQEHRPQSHELPLLAGRAAADGHVPEDIDRRRVDQLVRQPQE